jgi:hypothetical protein
MREANNNIHKFMCEEQYMHNERVWKIRHGLINQFLLQALLLDDL